MLVGYPPIAGQQKNLVLTKTVNAEWGFVMSDWRNISSSSLTLVGSMLALQTAERISINDCLNFQWVLRASSRKLLKASQDRIKIFVEKRRKNMHGGLMSIMSNPMSHHEKTLSHSPGRVQSFVSNNVGKNPNGSLIRNSMSMNNIHSLDRQSSNRFPQNIASNDEKKIIPQNDKSDGGVHVGRIIAARKQPSLSEEEKVCVKLKKTGFLQ